MIRIKTNFRQNGQTGWTQIVSQALFIAERSDPEIRLTDDIKIDKSRILEQIAFEICFAEKGHDIREPP